MLSAMTAALLVLPCLKQDSRLRAQTNDLRSFIVPDGAEYRGYSLTAHPFVNIPPGSGPTDGYLALGSRTAAGAHDKVHLLCIPDAATSTPATGTLIDIGGTSDLRAVAITPAGTSMNGNPANALVLQARGDQFITADHIDVLLVDADDPGNRPMIYNAYRLVDQAGGNLYPTSAVFDGNQTLFICGIYTTTSPYPNEPTLADSKDAFVASLDLMSGTANIVTYSSAVNSTPPLPVSPWAGAFNDYDAALRLRIINGNLMVVGSANGTALTWWQSGGGPLLWRFVNYSETWVANIDMTNLSIVHDSHFGTQTAPSYTDPSDGEGTYGIDIIEDVSSGIGGYFVVQNRVTGSRNNFNPGWYVTHVDDLAFVITPLQVSSPSSGSSTLFDTTGFTGKMFGAVRHTSVSKPERLTMYGTTMPWMTAMSFDVDFSSSAGISFASPAWWWYQSASGGSMGTPDPDYWLSTDLKLWSLPDMGAQYGAGSSPDYLGVMDNSYQVGGMSQPRFIQGGADGEYVPVKGCPAWQYNPPGITTIHFHNGGSDAFASGSVVVDMPPANIADRPHTIFSCKNGDPYRLTHNTANAVLPGGDLQVWPNPVMDYVDVTWGETLQSSDLTGLRLRDVTGREVYAATAQPAGNSAHFSLPPLANGIYMATFTISGMSPKTVKLSIQQ
jgi:hypothetical protein